MNKFIFLAFALGWSLFIPAQVYVAYYENFDPPSGPDSVTTYSLGSASNLWKDTNLVAVSSPKSYWGQVERGVGYKVVFETEPFNTKTTPYIFLSFYQICKIYTVNKGSIQIWNNVTRTWIYVDGNNSNYLGSSGNFKSQGYFTETSYSNENDLWDFNNNSTPTNSWWKFEQFDISDLAYNKILNSGYDSVKVRFLCEYNFLPPGTTPRAGWFVDDLMVTEATCELYPPKLNFDYNPIPCFSNNPKGSLQATSTNSYKIGVEAEDSIINTTSGLDSVAIFYRNHSSGVWQSAKMNLASGIEYHYTIPNLFVGDTVDYYVKAWDNACPNVSREPDSNLIPFYTFWPTDDIPPKCGRAACGKFPFIINQFPWVEDFEGNLWIVGTGTGNTGTQHRGNFPNEQRGQRYWEVHPNEQVRGYAWSIRNTPTATPLTGPSQDHTTLGSKYLYVEASQGNHLHASQLITPCIDLTSVTDCYMFEFYYHSYGKNIGTLEIDIDTGSIAPAWWNAYSRIRGQQQTSSTDPWKRALIPLLPFNGKMIRVRFNSIKQSPSGSGSDEGDMAIDDFRIFEPLQFEAEMLEYSEPINGLCSYANEQVKIVVRNNGCDTIRKLPIAFQVNSAVVQLDTIKVSIGLADTLSYSFIRLADLSSINTYTIKAWINNLARDTIKSNDTITWAINHYPQHSTFPFFMDFDNAPVGTNQTGVPAFVTEIGQDPNFQWVIGEKLTTTRNTGPFSGYYRKGKYMYTEATGSSAKRVSTFLTSEHCIDLTGMNKPTMDFFYHMYGGNFRYLQIQVSLARKNNQNWGAIPGGGNTIRPSSSNFSGELSDWVFHRVDLSRYAGQQIKLRFNLTRNSSAGDRADLAIDKVVIYDLISSDGGVVELDRPYYGSFAGNPFEPSIEVRNYGTSDLINPQVQLEITPLCGPNKGVSVTYPYNSNITIKSDSSGTIHLIGTGAVLPLGDCRVCAYTSIAGDSYNFNDTACRVFSGIGKYNIPFEDDFDNCVYSSTGFVVRNSSPTGGLLQWELGAPTNNGAITSVKSSLNCWATNIDGPFIDGTTEILRFPLLDNFDTIQQAEIRFWQFLDMGSLGDVAGTLEFLTSSNTFKPIGKSIINSNLGLYDSTNVGSLLPVSNWFLSNYGDLSIPILRTSTSPGLGEPGWTYNNSGWIFSAFPLSQFNLDTNVQVFQFRFASAPGTNPSGPMAKGGWAIDDIEIYIPPQNSVGPLDVKVVSPLVIPKLDQYLEVVMRNTGVKLLTKNAVDISIDGKPFLGSDTVYYGGRGIVFGNRAKHLYKHTWQARDVTTGTHQLKIITSMPNFKRDDLPFDDTTTATIQVLSDYDFNRATNDTIYCNDFEDNSGVLPFFAANTHTYFDGSTSWEKGDPVQFAPPPSGDSVWMTGLAIDYKSRDSSSLYTPAFNVDSSETYEISFYHWYETEKYHDGGNFEVSLNGGRTWRVIGFSNESNWYNTDHVTALDIIKPGWSGNSERWDTATYVFTFDNIYTAIFRFRFESDWDIHNKGWAIDQFCMKLTDKNPQLIIGRDEYTPSQSTYIGDLAPNPSGDISFLPMFISQPKDIKIKVHNLIGQLVYSDEIKLQEGSHQLMLDTFDWGSGVYVVNIELDSKTATRKLVVAK